MSSTALQHYGAAAAARMPQQQKKKKNVLPVFTLRFLINGKLEVFSTFLKRLV